MDKDYRHIGIETYGDRCEICGYASSVEVHHTHYQEHQALEDKLRKCKDPDTFLRLMEEARKNGWNYYVEETRQLDKGHNSLILSVLCGNCHTLIHKMDVGLKLLKAIKPRK